MWQRCLRCGMLAVGVILVAFTVAGCPTTMTPGDGTTGDGKPVLQRFNSPDELLQYFRDRAWSLQTRSTSLGGLFGAMAAAPAAADATAGSAENAAGDGSTSYSTTNLQEEGVDESDTFKSNGTHFFLAKDRSLRIVSATPATQMGEVGRVDFDDYVDSIYLVGSKVIVLCRKYATYDGSGAEIMIWPPYYEEGRVLVSEVDVTDPNVPALTRQNELDGSLASSRLTNGRLILVLTIAPPMPTNPNFFTVGGMTLENVLPKMRSDGAENDLVPPENWYRPGSPNGYYTTAVVTLDAENVQTVLGSVAVISDADTIYASTEAVYAANTEYDPDDNYREKTVVHKFALNDQGVAEYVASGQAPGTLLNQFSLGEYGGYLRLATHVNNWGGVVISADVGTATADAPVSTSTAQVNAPQAYNAVYVLKQNGASLDVTGSVENIAPNETLYAARFMGDHGFLVTYRKIDPLFVLDLSDPNEPAVVGELKVPGFSDYLHPVDDTHLIGVGKYTIATEQGFDWFQGVQISLFDVSDWSKPTAVQQITLGGRGSFAETDRTHKAFTYLPDRNLLVVPMQLYSGGQTPWDYGQVTFDGVVAFQVDKSSGFTELGRVADVIEDDALGYYYYYPYVEWRRAAVIGTALYAVTPDGVRSADLGSLSTTTTLELAPSPEDAGNGLGPTEESSPGRAASI